MENPKTRDIQNKQKELSLIVQKGIVEFNVLLREEGLYAELTGIMHNREEIHESEYTSEAIIDIYQIDKKDAPLSEKFESSFDVFLFWKGQALSEKEIHESINECIESFLKLRKKSKRRGLFKRLFP